MSAAAVADREGPRDAGSGRLVCAATWPHGRVTIVEIQWEAIGK
jgi:hypothetical protein